MQYDMKTVQLTDEELNILLALLEDEQIKVGFSTWNSSDKIDVLRRKLQEVKNGGIESPKGDTE